MGIDGKIIVGTGIGAGLFALINYVSKLKRTSAQLESVATAMIHSVKLDGLTIRIDVKLKNPTDTALKIIFPFVKLLFKGKVIGTSKAVNKVVSIPANGEANVNQIMIVIPPTGLLSVAGGLLTLVTKKQSAEITIKTITTIDLGWKKIPYEKTDTSVMKPKA